MPIQETAGVPLSLHNKVVLITGGSRGIGAATVSLFHQAGAKVVFSYQSSVARANELAAACGGPTQTHPIQHDLNTPEDGQSLIAATVRAFGRIDCLIVNHGIWPSHDQPVN